MAIILLAVLSVAFGGGEAPEGSAARHEAAVLASAGGSADAPRTGEHADELPVRHPAAILIQPKRTMQLSGEIIAPAGERPDTVWVWAYFTPSFPTGDSSDLASACSTSPCSWSDEPIAFPQPFAHGDTARFTVTGTYHWATTPDVPRDGFYARVIVSRESAAAARVPPRQRDYSREGMVPVETRY